MASYYRGTKYSMAQMQDILRQAGWPEDLIVTMSAIGQAESSGWSGAVNDSRPREYSVGLWQINIAPRLGRSWTEQELNDPLFNAQVALDLYHDGGLNHWGPYITGVYRKYLPAARAAYSGGGGNYNPPANAGGTGDETNSGEYRPSDNQSDFTFGGDSLSSNGPLLIGMALAAFFVARRLEII